MIGSAARAVALAALAAFAVAACGSGGWGALLVANLTTLPTVPWAVPVMAVVLWALWHWLGGRWWPRSTAAARRELLRSRMVAPRVFGWAWIAGALSLLALAGVWIVLVELSGVGGNPTIPGAGQYPFWTVLLGLLMGSLVSPLVEEAAFRGYGQVILERRLPPVAAVALSSLFFTLWHGPTQGFFWSKLLFFWLVGVVFGTTAFLTQSVLPALAVHLAGDLLFFLVIWPRDAARPLVWTQGADTAFWLSALAVVVCGGLAISAFARLRRTSAAQPPDRTQVIGLR